MAESLTIARPYAEAAFKLAREANALPQWSDALARLSAVVRSEGAHGLIGNPRVTDAQVASLVSDVAGTLSHEQMNFVSVLASNERLEVLPEIVTIFETLRKIHPVLKEQHFLNPKEEEDDPYESTQVTALVANEHGIFGVYSMREVFEYTQFWAVGSGREFALGAMHALYPKLRTAAAIAKAGIEAGATFDRNSGLPMTLYTIALKR